MQWLIDIIIAAVLPTGLILAWYGAKEDVPSGWQICDGTNGTPDLRERFIRGASDTYAPHYTSGSSGHTHDYTGDGHSHTIVGGDQIAAGAEYEALTSLSVGSGTTDLGLNVPPQHSLYWIMKL